MERRREKNRGVKLVTFPKPSSEEVSKVLLIALAMMKDGELWCRGVGLVLPDGTRTNDIYKYVPGSAVCAAYACQLASPKTGWRPSGIMHGELLKRVHATIWGSKLGKITGWNDDPHRTWEQVEAMFLEAANK